MCFNVASNSIRFHKKVLLVCRAGSSTAWSSSVIV